MYKDKEKQKAQRKRWAEANPEKVKASISKWMKANADKVKEHQRRYRDNNREKLRERDRKKYAENANEIKSRKKIWLSANPSKGVQYNTTYRAKNPDVSRNGELKRKYGIDNKDYERLYSEQDGKCRICGFHKKRLCVDHCHKTGRVRGLLCINCNAAIGALKDDPALLQRAINYLQ